MIPKLNLARLFQARLWAAIASFLSLTVVLPAQQVGTSPVKIFIMIGQSNMLGKGTIAPVETPGTLEYVVANDPGNHYQFLKSGANWVVRDDVWIRDQDPVAGGLTVGFGGEAAGLIGPELGFGHHAGDLYEQQVLIVKCAWGGKSLGNDFLPPSSGPYPAPQQAGDPGFYYQEVLRLVGEATTNLGTYFPGYNAAGGYEIAGICWHQGWNDRVTGAFADAYEVNMANFINDIRSSENGLDVPNLPFVIATTGMDGSPDVYSTVEIAQKKMDNSTGEYPPFAGNVAVVDTRTTYAYDNGLILDFWEAQSASPASEGYHWNRNAKTYLHIGLAMGDAMSTLSPSRCPARLRAVAGASGGIDLNWQNGTELPTSVQVSRGGVTLAATAPVDPPVFSDPGAEPGLLEYELVFAMTGDPCDPLTVTFDGSIADLEAFRAPGGVGLTWTNAMAYDGIEIQRDGIVIEAALSGTTTSYTDTAAPTSGLVTYTVAPTNGSSTPATFQINLNAAPSGNALIYEPFDYPTGGLNAQSGISEVGLEASWTANTTSQVVASSLTYGTLPVAGNSIGGLTQSQNRFGGSRGVRASALAANGLLSNGSSVWFSVIVGYGTGVNGTNARLAIALANNSFSTGNYDYSIPNGGTGSGVGFSLYAGGKVAATQFQDSTAGTGISGNVLGATSASLFSENVHGLIVGRIDWGAGTDTITLYHPDTDLVLPASPISTLSVNVDQETYDTITWARGDVVVMDEIRFGASYDAVVGADVTPDTDPPSPNHAAFLNVPAADSDSAISMTAQTGTDASGPVEYLFTETSGNPGGSSSAWQTSPSYTDTGLNASTQYTYTVTMRDSVPNTGTASAAASATTNAPDNTAPTPSPMTWASVPAAISNTAINMTATTASDPSGVEYFFDCLTPGGHDSGWQDSPAYTDTGLSPSTSYSYEVKARDKSANANETAASTPTASATTNSAESSLNLVESIDLSSSNAPAGSANFNISVDGAYQGYKGTANDISNAVVNVNATFNNPVTAYRFWNNPTPTMFGTYAQGGTIVSDLTTTDAAFQAQSTTRLWETTASNGNAFDTTPNYSSNTAMGNLDLGATGSVDITGMSAGSIYIFYGAYRSTASMNIAMTGSGSAGDKTIAELHNGDFANNNEYYMARVDFVNEDGFTSLDWGMASGFNGRLAGVVVTAGGGDPPTPYADWATTNSVTGGFGGDDDLDGMTNGQEWYYFINSDPQIPGSPGSPLTGATKTGANTFEFSHMRPLVRDDVSEAYEWSTDLDIWHANGASDGSYTVGMEAVGDGDSPYESVTITATISGGSPARVFLRQKLTNP